MTEQNKTQTQTEEQIRAEVRAEETKRLNDLLAAFPDDQEFALAQHQANATIDQAKVAYCDFLKKKLTTKNARVAELEAGQAAARKREFMAGAEAALKEMNGKAAANMKCDGASPVPQGGEPSFRDGGGFVTLAEAYMREHKCTFTEAAKQVCKTNPQAYAEYKAGL